MVLFLGQCVEEAQYFFKQPDWTLRIGNRTHQMRVKSLEVIPFEIQLEQERRTYQLHNWLALNQANYKTYASYDSLAKRMVLLENILLGHLKAFAEGIGLASNLPIKVALLEIVSDKWVSYKGVKVLTFRLYFKTNLFIPDFVALGKGITTGFGVVRGV